MKTKIKQFVTVVFSVGVIMGIGAAVGMSVAATRPVEAQVITREVPVLVTQPETIAPVMARIAECESSNQQFKNGQVLIHVNKDGSYDQGKFQINSIHNAAATKLGFDLSTEAGNEGFATWMYLNLGTGDWYSSEKCWKK